MYQELFFVSHFILNLCNCTAYIFVLTFIFAKAVGVIKEHLVKTNTCFCKEWNF